MSSRGGAGEAVCWSWELGTLGEGTITGCAAGDLFVHGRGLAFACHDIRAGTGELGKASAGEKARRGVPVGSRGSLMRLWASMASLACLWCCWLGPTLGFGPMHAS